MLTFLSSCLNFLRQKRLVPGVLILGIVVTGVCFGADASSAQYTESDLTQGIIEIFNLLFGLIALVLGPMVVLAGWLLSPDWTMGDFFGLRSYFLNVWVLVANIVYIIFALMLLYMAIMQIFGGAENEYAFKKKLGPFLIGILMVPFTWLIVSWTLSFANQAVAAVLSIPMGYIGKMDTNATPGKQNTSLWHAKVLPKEFNFSGYANGYGEDLKCTDGSTKNGTRCISPAEFLTHNQAGPFFIIMIYAYNIFKIQEADMAPLKNFCKSTDGTQYKSAKDCASDLMALVRDFGLSLIVTIFFAIMLIALCWVLLMRAIKLWIYIMLSPLFGLAYFTGKGFGESVGEAGESGLGQVGFRSFFQLAMVPVLVSAVLAFGLVFVGVVRDNFHSGKTQETVDQTRLYCTDDKVGYMVTYCITETPGTDGATYGSRLIIGTDSRGNAKSTSKGSQDALIILNFGDSFSKIISGAAGASVATGAGVAAGAIGSVDDIFAHLILTMLALVFMFMGVKMAVQYDAVTRAAFSPFEKLGNSVGNFVAHSPSYIPLPHPAFAAAMNPKNLTGMVEALRTKYDDKAAAPGKSMAQMISMPGLRDLGSRTGDELVRKFGNQVGSLEPVFSEFKLRLEKIIKSMPEGAEKDRLEKQLSQANTSKDQDILRDIATNIKGINEKSTTKFLNPDSDALIKGLADSTTVSDIRGRFNTTNQQYKNEENTISLRATDWNNPYSGSGDIDFRTTMKRTFKDSQVGSATEIPSMSPEKLTALKESLKSATGIDFSAWNNEQLKNLYNDAQKN